MKLSQKILFILTILLLPSHAFGITANDIHSVLYDSVYHDENGSCGTTASTASFPSGELPSSVPAPYNAIFSAAAKQYRVEPAIVAAIFYGGEHGGSWPEPPPPYGKGPAWASSSAGANGPFQFIPDTWRTYGVDADHNGKKDVQDLQDAAYGAAKYLAASGARLPKPDYQKAIFAYNHAQWYVDQVMAAFRKFGGKDATTAQANFNIIPSAYAASSVPSATSDLEGHSLPASKGGTGLEDPVQSNGRLTTTGEAVSFSQFAKLGQEYQDYYITMRWRYVKWNWDGTSVLPGPEKSNWYSQKPRKVLVTNPRTHKSVITAVLEAGPGPWTGVDTQPNNNPKQGWQNPQDGTPSAYRGRVSGLPPKATQEIGAVQRTADGKGDDLLYSWAPDQNAKPGPTDLSVTSDTPSCDAASAASTVDTQTNFIKKIVFPFRKTTMTPTAIVLHFTGSADASANTTIRDLKGNTTGGCTPYCTVQLTTDGEGKTYQLVEPLNVVTAHACGINSQALGIEIGGADEKQLLSNDRQFQGVVSAVATLVKKYNIPLVDDPAHKKGILSHQEADAEDYGCKNGKIDPGETYKKKVIAAVKEALK